MKKLAFLMMSLCLVPSWAEAVSNNALQRQIDILREDLQVLQRKMLRNGNGSGQNVVMEMGQMDETVRQTVGRMDMIEHKLKKLEEKIDLINKDIDVRIKMIEGKEIEANNTKLEAQKKKFEAPVAKLAPKSIVGDKIAKGNDLPEVKTKTAEQIYQEGLDAINKGDNDTAANRFTKVLTKFPKHKLAANAQYWLGESYYGKKEYAKAAVAFAKGYEKYKTGNKGADNILKLGMSMKMLGKNKEACTAFVSLPKEFPRAPENLKRKAASLAKELSCK